MEVQNVGGEYRSSFLSSTGIGLTFSQTFEVSDSHLLRAMLPGLEMAYLRVADPPVLRSSAEAEGLDGGCLKKHTLRTCRAGFVVNGRTTAVMLEFIQNDIKCTLTLLNEYMSSIYRPFITEERMFEEKAELFGYLHSCEEKKIAVSAVKEKIIYQCGGDADRDLTKMSC